MYCVPLTYSHGKGSGHPLIFKGVDKILIICGEEALVLTNMVTSCFARRVILVRYPPHVGGML